jgi:DMSO/TMAO reductase YedYZ molybdopterin-dependent catalytic subunit
MIERRDVLRGLLSTGFLLSSGWPIPALAQGDEVVPFTDFPKDFNPSPREGIRFFDTRTLQGFLTPTDQFFVVQHYNQPVIDPATYRLRITGLVDRPLELSLAELKNRPRLEQVVGFECSGNNNARGNPLIGNARWTGTALAPLVRERGLKEDAREVVFFSADQGTENVAHGGAPQKVDQHFARSLSLADALQPDVMLAYEMNGGPIPLGNGAPVRLIVPGWYGVAHVKWLDHVHVQDSRFMGRFMARDYVTLKSDEQGGEAIWNETSVGRMRLKSFVARVTRTGSTCRILGVALTDGTPLRTVEISIDNGPWRPAVLDANNTRYSWKLFTYRWDGPTSGEHTIVSRATDARGNVQPGEDALAGKKTRWENNGLYVRNVMIT